MFPHSVLGLTNRLMGRVIHHNEVFAHTSLKRRLLILVALEDSNLGVSSEVSLDVRVGVDFVRGEGHPCVAKRRLATVETNDPSVRALATE